MKLDPHKNKEKYLRWKERVLEGIPDISEESSKLIKQFLYDMEFGINVAKESRKGARSYARLNSLKDRLVFLAKQFDNRFKVNIVKISEEHVCKFFSEMGNGKIRKKNDQEYKSTAYYVKIFKSFWHWHMKVEKKKGKDVIDICVDLDTRREKPKWV